VQLAQRSTSIGCRTQRRFDGTSVTRTISRILGKPTVLIDSTAVQSSYLLLYMNAIMPEHIALWPAQMHCGSSLSGGSSMVRLGSNAPSDYYAQNTGRSLYHGSFIHNHPQDIILHRQRRQFMDPGLPSVAARARPRH